MSQVEKQPGGAQKSGSVGTISEVGAASAGIGVGAAFGSVIGVAAFGTAMSAALPLAALIGLIGWGGAKLVNKTRRIDELEKKGE